MRYFWVLFFFICVEDELQWLGRAFDLVFVMSEEELLLGHVFFAPVGLNKDYLGHNFSSDGPKVWPAYYSGPVSTLIIPTFLKYGKVQNYFQMGMLLFSLFFVARLFTLTEYEEKN